MTNKPHGYTAHEGRCYFLDGWSGRLVEITGEVDKMGSVIRAEGEVV